MSSPSSSNVCGTWAPASFNAWFLARAVSLSALAHDPAWPNCTYIQTQHTHTYVSNYLSLPGTHTVKLLY